jgi:hypothetical protein
MTTTVSNSESDAVAVGPPPPFDPELAPALAARAAILERTPVTLTADILPPLRQAQAQTDDMTDEELGFGGAFAVSERTVHRRMRTTPAYYRSIRERLVEHPVEVELRVIDGLSIRLADRSTR